MELQYLSQYTYVYNSIKYLPKWIYSINWMQTMILRNTTAILTIVIYRYGHISFRMLGRMHQSEIV